MRPPERRRVLQLVLGIVLYAVCQIVFTVVAVIVYAATTDTDGSVNVGDVLSASGPAAPVGFLVGALVAALGFRVVVRRVAGRAPSELQGPGALHETLIGLAIGAGVVAVGVGVLAVLGVYRVDRVHLGPSILAGLMLGVGPGVMEEVFFRGFLLRLLDGWLGSWPALAIVSLVFAAFHAVSSPAGPVAALFVLLTASLLLNVAFLLTRRLWLPIAVHAAFNAAQSAIFGLSVTGSAVGGSLLRAHLHGSDLLTGGDVGGEGSLAVIGAALVGGIAMTVVAVRRGVMLPRDTGS